MASSVEDLAKRGGIEFVLVVVVEQAVDFLFDVGKLRVAVTAHARQLHDGAGQIANLVQNGFLSFEPFSIAPAFLAGVRSGVEGDARQTR